MPHTCSRRGISLACHRMIARAHAVDSGCEACHRTYDCGGARFILAPAWHLIGLPSDDCQGACGGFRVRGVPSHVRLWGCADPPPPASFHAGCLGNLSVESPWHAIGRLLGRTRRIQGARHAIARTIWRCAIYPSPGVIPCRLPRGHAWRLHRC